MRARVFHKLALKLLLLLVGLFWSRAAWAHKPSDAYLFLTVDGPTVHTRWDIALREIGRAHV